jgi:topoisomerase-4 subunit B
LIIFFFQEMPELIAAGRLYLAQPPLYRLTASGVTRYARDDGHKDALMQSDFKGKSKVEVSRFKGLGEMPAAQLRETTMDPATRTLLRVVVTEATDPDPQAEERQTRQRVEHLMGRKPELRFAFIQENARFVAADDLDV